MLQFSKKTVLITGASEGIGRATAKEFASQGANLILVSRNFQRLKELSEELSKFDVKIQIEALDLSNTKAIDDFFSQISELDIAINNAGVEGPTKQIHDFELNNFDEVFNVNVRALFQCLKHEVYFFRKNKKPGSIVNISSIAGSKGIAYSSLYVASKHAVLGFTRAVAVEQIKHGIRVNCVSPGATDTAMLRRIMGPRVDDFIAGQPNGKFATPESIAATISWLCRSESENIVGQDIIIDGGKTVNLA